MVRIIYHGHSAFELISEKYTILIDPFFRGNKHAKKNADVKADFIILTHAHADHFGDTVEIARNNNSLVIAVHELSNLLISKGVNSHGMGIGGQREFPFGKVKYTIAHHSSSFDLEGGAYMGEAAGVIVNISGKTIYHAGDTALFLDMKLIGEMHSIDVAMLPIGDNYTMGIDDAVKAVEFLNCKTAVPIHYGTFPVIDTNPEEFRRKVESIGRKCCVIQPGGELVI